MPYQPLTAKEAMRLALEMEDWQTPFMQFVDDFRRTSLAEKSKLIAEEVFCDNERWLSLLKAIINQLCFDANISSPEWAYEMHWLKKPWFVSGLKNLYAMCIVESPLFFRRNNIFVTRNFLDRC